MECLSPRLALCVRGGGAAPIRGHIFYSVLVLPSAQQALALRPPHKPGVEADGDLGLAQDSGTQQMLHAGTCTLL